MYSCPERQREDRKPVLSGTGCQEVAWNKESQKYLKKDTLDGRPVQMLIDTGCTNTIVSASYIIVLFQFPFAIIVTVTVLEP